MNRETSCRVVPFLASFWTNNVREACPLRHPKQFSDDKKLSGVSLHRRNVLSTWNRNQWKYYLGSWDKCLYICTSYDRKIKIYYLCPRTGNPLNGTVNNIAILLSYGSRRRTKSRIHLKNVIHAMTNFLNTIDASFLDSTSTTFWAGCKIGYIPTWRTRNIIACSNWKKINGCIRMYYNLMCLLLQKIIINVHIFMIRSTYYVGSLFHCSSTMDRWDRNTTFGLNTYYFSFLYPTKTWRGTSCPTLIFPLVIFIISCGILLSLVSCIMKLFQPVLEMYSIFGEVTRSIYECKNISGFTPASSVAWL